MHIESKSFILYAMKNGGGNNILALIHQVFLELNKIIQQRWTSEKPQHSN